MKRQQSLLQKALATPFPTLIFTSAIAITASPSLASGRTSLIDEVVVTAQKREQSADSVGVAISAFSADQMKALNFTNAADVALQSPNVEIRRNFAGRGVTTNLFIRGVGNTDLNNGAESPVAAFVDDFYLISSSTVDFSLFDMARTEVLKGPQGTLFGRNATGGAFAFHTQKPQKEQSAFLEGTVGTDGILRGELRLNQPLSDTLILRLSAYHDSNDPLVKNNYPGQDDFRETNFRAYRGQLSYQPNQNWDSLLKIETGEAVGNLVGDNLRPMMKSGDDVIFADTNLLGAARDADPFNVSHNSESWASNNIRQALWTNVWTTDSFTLTAISGILKQDMEIVEDCDASAVSICNFMNFYDSSHYSHELRINAGSNKLNWTAGLYYLKQDADGGYNFNAFNGLLGAPLPDNAGVLQHADFVTTIEARAAYGQIEYAFNDNWTAIAGLRIQNDQKSLEQEDVQEIVLVNDFDFDGVKSFGTQNLTPIGVVLGGNTFTRESVGELTKIEDDEISGTLQLNWTPADDLLYYASFRRGIKAGGFNLGIVPIGLPAEQWAYAPEELHAYEIGAKLKLGEGKYRVNTAAFYYDYDNYQALSFQNLGQFFVNRPAKISGAEIEISANLIEGLDILFGASYLDSTVDDVQRGVLVSTTSDREMGEAPQWTANWVVRYEWPFSSGYLAAQVDGNYVDERYGDILNQSAATLDSYSLWNGSLTFTQADDQYYLRLWVKNLNDKEVAAYRVEVTDLLNSGQENFIEPRTAGLTVGYNF